MDGEITLLLQRWHKGDVQAREALIPHVYPHLREVASSYLRRESEEHTLQPTALVHELYLRLIRQRKAEWNDRAHFYAFSAKLMRMILADFARSAKAEKRGGNAAVVPLSDLLPWVNMVGDDWFDLTRALDELEQLDPRKARLVELRFFLGCTVEECAEIAEVSIATAERDLVFARSWLYRRLNPNAPSAVEVRGAGTSTQM